MIRVEESSLAKVLTDARKNKGIKQRDAADKIGVTPASLSAYETGAATPSIAVIIRIADFYDVSLDALLRPERWEKEMRTYGDAARAILNIIESGSDYSVTEEAGETNTGTLTFNLLLSSKLLRFLSEYKKNQVAIREFGGGEAMFQAWLSSQLSELDQIPFDYNLSRFGPPDVDDPITK